MSKLSRIPTTAGRDGNTPRELQQQQQQEGERDLIVFKAQICEQSNRFEDMVSVMKELCHNHQDLTNDERNLLSCAYKNVIGFRRTSWKVVSEVLEASLSRGNQSDHGSTQNHHYNLHHRHNVSSIAATITTNNTTDAAFDCATIANPTVIKPFLFKIERELKEHCNDIINILNTRLINSSSATGESRVFYYKMKGDYTRYLCETCEGNERQEKANESLLAYKTASEKALIDLPPTHPVRLGLMLNFSVFYYEIMKSPERSCRLAKQAFDDAIAELDTLSEESYLDSTIIMQLLRDNLNFWESEQRSLSPSEQQQMQYNTRAGT